VVVSSFALGYFEHPERALLEFERVLTDDGRCALCVCDTWWFQGDAEWQWHEDLLVRIGARLGYPRFPDEDALADALQSANFQIDHLDTEIFPLELRNTDEWWRAGWSHGYRRVLGSLDPGSLDQYRAQCFERLSRQTRIVGRLQVLVAACHTR